MSIVAGPAKTAVLTAILLCLSILGPGPRSAEAERVLQAQRPADAGPARLHCRIYFGCLPALRLASTPSQQ